MLELIRHDWPGNVRELRQLMEYVACPRTPCSSRGTSRIASRHAHSPTPSRRAIARCRGFARCTRRRRSRARSHHRALAATSGVPARASALIGMPLRTFITKLKRYDIKPR
jgi:two-component system, NtrC family, response regulator AtoC